jgi:hypothetical protein
MSKINLITEEKDYILKLHKKEVNNLFEQVAKNKDEALSFFNKARENTCLKDPNLDFTKIFSKEGTSKVYIKGVSQKTGNVKRVFDDYTWEVVDPTGKQLSSGRWTCNTPAKPDPSKDQDEKLKKYFEQWVAYYSGQPQYEGVQIKHELNVTPVEKSTWKEVSIPNSVRDMGSQKFIYISSKKEEEPNKPNASLKDVRTSSDYSKDECEKIIEQWYQNFSTKPDDFDKAYFDAEKPKAMYCKRRFYKKWGVDFNAGRLNKIIEFMSRNIDTFERRTSPSLRSPWKLD